MNTNIESKAMEDYIILRCLEIVEDNQEHITLNHEIALLENELLKTASEQQKNIIFEIDRKKEKVYGNDIIKIYKSALNDRIAI